MTDEQLKMAAPSAALMELVGDAYLGALTKEGAAQYTADVIKALQKDGQYIVFAAPPGYRFGASKVMAPEDLFPSFHVHTQGVTPVIAGESCAGIKAVTLEPLTGGIE